jgi:hypothetical protein
MVDGEGIVIDLARTRVLGFNPTGSLVWSLLADQDEDAIVDAVSQRFEIAPDAAREDVREFLATLLERGLIERVA